MGRTGKRGVHISIYHSFVRILWRRWSNLRIEWHLERHYLQAIVLDSNWWWIHGDNGRLPATGLSSMMHRRHRFGCLLQTTQLCRHSLSWEQTTTTKTIFHRNAYRSVHPSTGCPMHRILNKYVHLMPDRMGRILLERPFWPDCKLCSQCTAHTDQKEILPWKRFAIQSHHAQPTISYSKITLFRCMEWVLFRHVLDIMD